MQQFLALSWLVIVVQLYYLNDGARRVSAIIFTALDSEKNLKRVTTGNIGNRMKALNSKSIYTPKWSPDGKQLVYQQREHDKWSLHIIDGDGKGHQQIFNMEAKEPHWSPDGENILFQSGKSGNWKLYIINLATRHVDQLTVGPHDDIQGIWSPDGRTIAFLSNRTGEYSIHLLELKTGEIQLLDVALSRDAWFRMSWSPDNSKIAFTGRMKSDTHPNQEGTFIYTLDISTCELNRITEQLAFYGNVNWSPDGKWMVFDGPSHGKNESGNGQWEIFRVDIDGNNLQQLTSSRYNIWGPNISPDSNFIAVSRGFDDLYEIYIHDLVKGKTNRITHDVFE